MRSNAENDAKRHDKTVRKPKKLGRRELMKFGVAAGVAAAGMTSLPGAFGQAGQAPPKLQGGIGPANNDRLQRWPDIEESEEIRTSVQIGYITKTGAGWVNNSGRSNGNGPMDECSRRIVEWVHKFSEHDLSDSCMNVINYLQYDTVGSLYGGFESEPARINARLASTMPGPCTLMGYGLKTTYEMAAFGNAAMIRHTDFNAMPHNNEMFGGVLAVGEALHSSGPQIMAAMAICYEVIVAIGNTGQGNYDPSGWDSPYHSVGTAMACGKLMGLNQDQLANALSLALVPHMPMYVCHVGTQSMWKGTHSAEQVRNGVWAAMLAREGMTGPCMPFEGRDGLIEHIGPFVNDLKLPARADGMLAIESTHGGGRGFKRTATEGNNLNFHENIAPQILAWTKPEEIAAIDAKFHYWGWQEICDPTKWDPRNRETADHSAPYNVARMLLDGHIYLDSFTKEKYMDPLARELMAKITFSPNRNPEFGGDIFTVRKKSGEEKTFTGGGVKPMSMDELKAKYYRLAEFMSVDKGQADRAIALWTNLQAVKDIGEPIALIAKFGQPKALTDKSPSRIA